MTQLSDASRVSTGIPGLDEIMGGGLLPGRAYLVRGAPGSGKTILGLHFLTASNHPEKSLLITMGEPEDQLRRNAAVLGFNLDRVSVLDLSPTSDYFTQVQSYDIFSAAEVEREPTTQRIITEIERLHPERVFIDSMTQMRYLATDPHQYHMQVLSFLRYLVSHGATVLFTSEASPQAPDEELQFLSDGVIHLAFLPEGRYLSVTKFRGASFLSGRHGMQITDRGIQVFPRLVPGDFTRQFEPEPLSSGIPSLDEMLHGGLERGTVTILSGPTGVGKTTLGMQFMKEAAGRGERSVVYCFEEIVEVLLRRCEGLNIPVRRMMETGNLAIVKIEPLQYGAEELAYLIRQEVEQNRPSLVMIDSLSGYRLSVQGADLLGHIHAVCKFLANMGVTVLLVDEVENITGEFRPTRVGVSYLADNIVFLRYLEYKGELRKVIGVLKKRLSGFEKTLREIDVTRYGITVGRPLTNLRGILSGVPVWAEEVDNGG